MDFTLRVHDGPFRGLKEKHSVDVEEGTVRNSDCIVILIDVFS